MVMVGWLDIEQIYEGRRYKPETLIINFVLCKYY